MNPLQYLAGQTLQWRQPPLFAKQYHLLDADGKRIFAEIKWVRDEGGAAAMAIAGVHTWHFDRVGRLLRRIEVRQANHNGEVVATMQGWTHDGTLTLADDGRQFKWHCADAWRSSWEWLSADDGEIMQFTLTHELKRITRSEAKLTLTAAAADFPDVPLLATLGWYLMILRAIDPANPTAP